MLDFRVGSNWLILCLLNFESCQLWHQLSQTFLHQFQKFLCPSWCKFPEFSKAPPTSSIWLILKLWPKIRKMRNQKICQLEATLKLSFFSVWKFSNFFFIPRSIFKNHMQNLPTFEFKAKCEPKKENAKQLCHLSIQFSQLFINQFSIFVCL